MEDNDVHIHTLEGADLKKFQEESYKAAFGMTREEAWEAGKCVKCSERVHEGPEGEKGAVYTRAGKSEYRISGVCETCFDEMFREPDEEEDE